MLGLFVDLVKFHEWYSCFVNGIELGEPRFKCILGMEATKVILGDGDSLLGQSTQERCSWVKKKNLKEYYSNWSLNSWIEKVGREEGRGRRQKERGNGKKRECLEVYITLCMF